MLAVDLVRSHSLEPDLILNDPENTQLLMTLLDFSQKLKRYGFDVKVCTTAALMKLNEIDSAKKTEIRNYFENWGRWIEPDASETGVLEVDLEQEKVFLKRALDHYGLWIDDEFWKSMRHGQVVEIYSPNMVQLYRNIHFFQYSSFSLLEISIFEWFHLWQRPKLIQEAMMKSARAVLDKMIPILAYDVPRHVLRETKIPGVQSDHDIVACLVQFKNVGSVRRGLDRTPAGAIATSEAEIIAVGDEARQIQFV